VLTDAHPSKDYHVRCRLGAVDLRRAFFSRSMKMLQHPRVAKMLADPRAMDLFVAAIRWKERAGDALLEAQRKVVSAIGLATQQELRDLKTVIRDLERRVRRSED
jgi:hypothetical protein